jgi:hypothetical protein
MGRAARFRRANRPVRRAGTATGLSGPHRAAIRHSTTPSGSGSVAGMTDRRALPSEAIDEAPITVDAASELMADLGFLAFRTPPGTAVPDSCLMAMIRDAPTRRHFDPELASYWVIDDGRGRVEVADRDTTTPLTREFSWGRIRLVDRFGARNSFVSFGGVMDAERVGPDALLLVFRSPAPILRLRGHSQREDRTAEEVLTFFGRLVPRLWQSPAEERMLGAASPEALYAAFMLHSTARSRQSTVLREAISDDVRPLLRELRLTEVHRPHALSAARALLERMDLARR